MLLMPLIHVFAEFQLSSQYAYANAERQAGAQSDDYAAGFYYDEYRYGDVRCDKADI